MGASGAGTRAADARRGWQRCVRAWASHLRGRTQWRAVARTRHYQRPKNSRGRARRAAVLAMDRMPAPAQQQGRVRAGIFLTTEILLQGGRICGALNLALRTGVLEGEVLIRELLAVDGLATGTVAAGEVLLLLVPKWCCWCCWCC